MIQLVFDAATVATARRVDLCAVDPRRHRPRLRGRRHGPPHPGLAAGKGAPAAASVHNVVAASQGVASGMVQVAVLSVAPTLCLWLALHFRPVLRFGQRLVRSVRHAVHPPPIAPVGPPLERIAADIRRIAASIEALPRHAPVARRHGALLAYDDALGAACRALGIEDTLTTLPFGRQRDAARLRTECELQIEGLVIDTRRAA